MKLDTGGKLKKKRGDDRRKKYIYIHITAYFSSFFYEDLIIFLFMLPIIKVEFITIFIVFFSAVEEEK